MKLVLEGLSWCGLLICAGLITMVFVSIILKMASGIEKTWGKKEK